MKRMNRLLFLGAFAATAAFSLSVAEAAAPPRLVSATPAKDSHVPWPKQIILKFNEPLAADGLQIQMIKPDGSQIPLEAPIPTKDQVLAEVKTPTLAGPYMIMWQVKSASGAPAKGDYTFFVQ
jgi:methionine-rich copper-binding protein CopC